LRRVRRLLVVLLVGLAGCGGVPEDPLKATLAFFPENAPVLAVVDTDLGGDQQRALREISRRFRFSPRVVPQLQDPQLAPLLGNPAVIGASDPRALSDRRKLVAAVRPRQPDKVSELRRRWVESGRSTLAGREAGFRILRDSDGALNAFDGQTLVLSESPELLSRALRRRDEDEGIDAGDFTDSLDDIPGHGLVAMRIDADALLAVAGPRIQGVPFFADARTLGAKLTVRSDAVDVRFRMRTEDPVESSQLPLATGNAAPPVAVLPGELGIGVREPGQLLRFLRQGGAGLGTPRFEERVGIQFTRDFVKQLRGEAAVSIAPRGAYAFRAEVRDPAAMRRTLAGIARRAADAARNLQGDVISITPPRDAGGVYRLDRIGDDAAFGLFGNKLVFADTRPRVLAMAKAPARRVPGARGALVMTAQSERLGRRLLRVLDPAGGLGGFLEPDIALSPLGRFDASVEAEEDGLRGRLTQRVDR
jgi:hypothetical protein